jgi:hypothetical protein
VADTRTAADKVEAAQIRAWAQRNGWPELGTSGRIPAAARAAWHDRGEDLEDQDPGDPDEDQEQDPGGGDGQELTPPASLDEARARAGLDPDAAHLRGRGRRRPPAGGSDPKPPPVKITPAVRRDIAGKLAFWLSIPAEPWYRIDPYCGAAYAQQIDQIAIKAAPLICQSPDLVRWFRKSSTFIMWTELGMACRPVAEAVIAHHITKRITLNSEGQAVEQPDAGMDFGPYSGRQPNPAAQAAA